MIAFDLDCLLGKSTVGRLNVLFIEASIPPIQLKSGEKWATCKETCSRDCIYHRWLFVWLAEIRRSSQKMDANAIKYRRLSYQESWWSY